VIRLRWIIAVLVAARLAQVWIPEVAALPIGSTLSGAGVGFVAGLIVTIFFGFALGWNRRGDYEQDQAIEGVKKKNAGNRI
jgi:ABC-type nitrate/sulfonate/bicarbonate transport system permease component